jgi:hypothetical protein
MEKTKVAGKRSQPEAVKVSSPGRVQQARKNGPHRGSVKNADGSTQATPNPGHKPGRKSNTDGGN